MEALTEKIFPFPKGRLTALVGRNGAGKTTLIRNLLSQVPATELARIAAYVPQEHYYPRDLLLGDLLRFSYLPAVGLFGKLPSREDPEIQHALRLFDLQPLANRPLARLSTGERQKAFLARAILQKPRVLFLDEPTNHLDPGALAVFWEHLLEMRRQLGFEVVVSTHDLTFLKRHAEWIRALVAGKIAFEGEAERFWAEDWPRKIFGARL